MKELLFEYYKNKSQDINQIKAIEHLLELSNGCYLMAKEFSEELIKLNLNLTFNCLQQLHPITYIEFPEHLIKFFEKDGVNLYIKGCFLLVSGERIIISFFALVNNKLNIYNTDPLTMSDINSFLNELNPMMNEVKDIENKTGVKCNFIEQIIYAIKCGIYIKTGSPDIRHLKPKKFIGKNKKSLRKHKRNNPYDYEVIFVGFNFKKSVTYSKDGTVVKQHLRVQHYGKNLSEIKIITIHEHDRKFKNVLGKEYITPIRQVKINDIYFIRQSESNFIKIGRAKNNKSRLNRYDTHNPIHLEVVKIIKADYTKEYELREYSERIGCSKITGKERTEWRKVPEGKFNEIKTLIINKMEEMQTIER